VGGSQTAGQLGERNYKVVLGRCVPPLPWPQRPLSERLRTKRRAPNRQATDHCAIL
jgi:hypothetical protein